VFPKTVYSILEDNGHPIGFEALNEGDKLHLIDIAILPEYRNGGLGRYRLERLMEKSEASGKVIMLMVEIFNPAKRLYERLGFEVTEDQGVYQRMIWKPH
jgi:ribosomal protein S18 acetylase RimI-like enzyme